jgi:hypothetical protein
VGILYLITILGLILFLEWRYPVAGFRSDVLIRVRPGDEAKVINGLDKMVKNGVYDARLVFGMHDIVATVSAINDEAAIEIIMKIREIPDSKKSKYLY